MLRGVAAPEFLENGQDLVSTDRQEPKKQTHKIVINTYEFFVIFLFYILLTVDQIKIQPPFPANQWTRMIWRDGGSFAAYRGNI